MLSFYASFIQFIVINDMNIFQNNEYYVKLSSYTWLKKFLISKDLFIRSLQKEMMFLLVTPRPNYLSFKCIQMVGP